MAQHESFLVRVWWRARPGEGQWVGRLEHLQKRQVQTFHDPEALLEYLRALIIPSATRVSEWRPGSGPILDVKQGSNEPEGDDLTAEASPPKVGGKSGGLDFP